MALSDHGNLWGESPPRPDQKMEIERALIDARQTVRRLESLLRDIDTMQQSPRKENRQSNSGGSGF